MVLLCYAYVSNLYKYDTLFSLKLYYSRYIHHIEGTPFNTVSVDNKWNGPDSFKCLQH